MIATPQTSQLFAVLWDYLDLTIREYADIMETHPNLSSDMQGDRGQIVTLEVNDSSDGRWLTDAISLPGIQFSCYHQNEQGCRLLLEKVMEVMSDATSEDFPMSEQQVQQFYREQRFAVRYSNEIGGYYGAVVYRFHLSGKP